MRKKNYDEDDDRIVEDGEFVRVPLHLMDARQRAMAARFGADDLEYHRPGYRTSDAAEARDARAAARDARQAWIKDMTTAWARTPHIVDAPQPDLGSRPEELRGLSPERSDPAGLREQAYEQRCRELANAWRNPPGRTDPDAAVAIERSRRAYTYETGR